MVNKSDALSDSGNSENDSVKVEIIELEELDNKQKKKRKPGGFKIRKYSERHNSVVELIGRITLTHIFHSSNCKCKNPATQVSNRFQEF